MKMVAHTNKCKSEQDRPVNFSALNISVFSTVYAILTMCEGVVDQTDVYSRVLIIGKDFERKQD